LRDSAEQADWLRTVRAAAADQGYGLVINARIDVFLAAFAPGGEEQRQARLVGEALRRAHAYVEAGADCVFPILLWQPDALQSFISQSPGPVNALKTPQAPSHSELAELGSGAHQLRNPDAPRHDRALRPPPRVAFNRSRRRPEEATMIEGAIALAALIGMGVAAPASAVIDGVLDGTRHQRVDTPAAPLFLGQNVPLP
jgi:hypothetical protein